MNSLHIWVGLGWCSLVLAVAWQWRPRPVQPLPVAVALRSAHPRPAWHRAVGVGVAGSVVSPLLGLAASVGVLLGPILRTRRAVQTRRAALVRELPEVIDLLRLAVSAGGTLHSAVHAVGRVQRGPATEAFANVSAAVERGMRLAEALDRNTEAFGEPGRSLLTAIVSAERYGAPLVPVLDRLGNEARDERRRHAEMVARKVPIRMLLPLVVCVLPAFILVTLVPTLVGSFSSLNLGG